MKGGAAVAVLHITVQIIQTVLKEVRVPEENICSSISSLKYASRRNVFHRGAFDGIERPPNAKLRTAMFFVANQHSFKSHVENESFLVYKGRNKRVI